MSSDYFVHDTALIEEGVTIGAGGGVGRFFIEESSTVAQRTGWVVRSSIASARSRSRREHRLSARPLWPARPVRPTR